MRQKLGRTLEELREQTNHSRMSEARYRELVENINSGVAIFNYLAEKQEFVLIDINSRSIESDTIKLPVFNTIAINIQQEMAKLDPDIKLVEKNITADQALSTRVLRIANSSFYRGLNEISTIKSAIMRLGAEEITKIVLLATTKELFKSKNKLINELMTKLWLHSLGCAYGSAWLSRRHIYAVDQCESFFAGLLHDIGKLLVLMVIDEVNSHEIQNKLSDSLCHEAMEKLHTQEGGKLLDQWGIPKKFCFIATEHHSTIISDNNLLLVLVRMANIACQKIGIGMKIDETLILPATIEANILNLSEIDLAELEIFLEDTQKLFSDRP
jgi:HD-like signal output (HDOD) protein